MGFFERPDPRLAQCADPPAAAAVARALGRHALSFALAGMALALAYGLDVGWGLRQSAATSGTVTARGLYDPVTIERDERDIPHIRARNEHDLYFAEGYVEGADRLFQLDLTRRYAYGRLAEVLGPKALPYDRVQRAVGIAGIAARQLAAMASHDRSAVEAFSAGVNAAAAADPVPVEFRMLLYGFDPWTPQDSLAVSIVASLELADSWQNVFARDAVWRTRGERCFNELFPLSDVRYDVTTDGRRQQSDRRASPEAPLSAGEGCDAAELAARYGTARNFIGSNAWAAGGARTSDGHALIANDPHLDLTIPGIWYVVDLRSPQVHVAGATVPGIPGVVLGHNERLAWASTNAAMATTSVFATRQPRGGRWVRERFHVRFASDLTFAYYRTAREFSVPDPNDASRTALVRWPLYAQTHSTIETGLALDRARDVRDALRILAQYRGSPQNFVLADRDGEAAYHVAGLVPDDPAWGRYVHPARDLRSTFVPIPFAQLPGSEPSRRGVFVSANNKAYGPGYRYRLSAQFEPPYRAFRIASLLNERAHYDVGYFERMQLDTLSPVDLEIARGIATFLEARRIETTQPGQDAVALLRDWDGRYSKDSQAAVLEHQLRDAVFSDGPAFNARLEELRGLSKDDSSALGQDIEGTLALFAFQDRRQWRDAGAMRIEHLLAPMHFGFLDGDWLPGEGDEYTIHLQEPGLAQGFRAVWDAGDWDRGGISIPSGESGAPGSGHYTDLTTDWIGGTLRPLPFGDAAVKKAAVAVLVLRPR